MPNTRQKQLNRERTWFGFTSSEVVVHGYRGLWWSPVSCRPHPQREEGSCQCLTLLTRGKFKWLKVSSPSPRQNNQKSPAQRGDSSAPQEKDSLSHEHPATAVPGNQCVQDGLMSLQDKCVLWEYCTDINFLIKAQGEKIDGSSSFPGTMETQVKSPVGKSRVLQIHGAH